MHFGLIVPDSVAAMRDLVGWADMSRVRPLTLSWKYLAVALVTLRPQ